MRRLTLLNSLDYISGCGDNVLPYLFEVADEYNLPLLLRYFGIPEINLYDFSINGKHFFPKGYDMVGDLMVYSE
ncbi:hypothetical protein AGMMS49975_21640 [Clostridia bacterium]|nr:hypothetical protein AGMMS49975_21640 [Clostridia bacterium]